MNRNIAPLLPDAAAGSLKEKWGDLTDDEITRMSGERDKIVGMLPEKYGDATEKAEAEVDGFMRDNV